MAGAYTKNAEILQINDICDWNWIAFVLCLRACVCSSKWEFHLEHLWLKQFINQHILFQTVKSGLIYRSFFGWLVGSFFLIIIFDLMFFFLFFLRHWTMAHPWVSRIQYGKYFFWRGLMFRRRWECPVNHHHHRHPFAKSGFSMLLSIENVINLSKWNFGTLASNSCAYKREKTCTLWMQEIQKSS